MKAFYLTLLLTIFSTNVIADTEKLCGKKCREVYETKIAQLEADLAALKTDYELGIATIKSRHATEIAQNEEMILLVVGEKMKIERQRDELLFKVSKQQNDIATLRGNSESLKQQILKLQSQINGPDATEEEYALNKILTKALEDNNMHVDVEDRIYTSDVNYNLRYYETESSTYTNPSLPRITPKDLENAKSAFISNLESFNQTAESSAIYELIKEIKTNAVIVRRAHLNLHMIPDGVFHGRNPEARITIHVFEVETDKSIQTYYLTTQ